MNNENIQKQSIGNQLIQKLITKSWEDPIFKKNLMSNPIKTIETLTGSKVKANGNMNIKVSDQTDQSIIFLNIPRNISGEELFDEQLDQVVGGIGDACQDFGQWTANRIEDAFEWVVDNAHLYIA